MYRVEGGRRSGSGKRRRWFCGDGKRQFSRPPTPSLRSIKIDLEPMINALLLAVLSEELEPETHALYRRRIVLYRQEVWPRQLRRIELLRSFSGLRVPLGSRPRLAVRLLHFLHRQRGPRVLRVAQELLIVI